MARTRDFTDAADSPRYSDVDDPAGVDDIIRCVGHASGEGPKAVLVPRQLIVSTAADQGRAKVRDRIDVEDGAQGVRGEDLRVCPMDALHGDDLGPEPAADLFRPPLVHIGDHEAGVVLVQERAKLESDRAQTLHRDVDAGQRPPKGGLQ